MAHDPRDGGAAAGIPPPGGEVPWTDVLPASVFPKLDFRLRVVGKTSWHVPIA